MHYIFRITCEIYCEHNKNATSINCYVSYFVALADSFIVINEWKV